MMFQKSIQIVLLSVGNKVLGKSSTKMMESNSQEALWATQIRASN